MEFRLIYQGPLPAAGDAGSGRRSREKHHLRKWFHPQLRELWRQHPDLRQQYEANFVVSGGGLARRVRLAVPGEPGRTWVEQVANDHQVGGGRFVPLVSEAGGFTCSLEILFLRRGQPGDLIASGGDIDNRIKVLLDGLRMPKDGAEFGGLAIDVGEDPFFCLLEDDNLVTNITVTTDRLLTPLGEGEAVNDVCLIVHATIIDPGALFVGGRLV